MPDIIGLITTLTGWLTRLIPAAGVLMVMYHAGMKAVSADEQAAAVHGRAIRTVMINTALGTGASGILTFVLAQLFH